MSSYEHDFEAFGEFVLSADFMVEEMGRRAEKVKAAAEAAAPVGGEGDPHPGLYRDSFSVESGVRDEPSRRAYGRVVSDAPYAIDLEYGTADTPKFRTLGKALDAARD